jgi:hypothetical protein
MCSATEIVGFEQVELGAHLVIQARNDVFRHVTLRKGMTHVATGEFACP